MHLSFSQIQSITLGATRITEEADGFHFYRFTPEQEIFYTTDGQITRNVLATSGVKLSFVTESENLFLKINTKLCGTRNYFALDVFVNGRFIGDIRNFEETELPRKYVQHPLPVGSFSGKFDLGEGKKDVCIHLPWNTETVIEELSLDDGASLTPQLPAKKLLCFGDSITQGFDALHPSRRYTARIAEFLGMEEYNKAIGGEKFQPELAKTRDSFSPALITVAYGTNDWRRREKWFFDEMCRGFFENLRKTYPETPIVAITPLWRKIWEREYDCGPFRGIHETICRVAEEVSGITVIDAFSFIPPYSDYFADLTLHPNGAGYDRYAEGLFPILKKMQDEGVF